MFKVNFYKVIKVIKIIPLFSLFLYISCNTPDSVQNTACDTLRSAADNFVASTDWTEELEGDILKENVAGADGIDVKIDVTPNNIISSGNEKTYKAVYPILEGFSSLDISSLNENELTFVKNFCSAFILDFSNKDETEENSTLSTEPAVESFFEKNKIFTYLVFYYDLMDLFPQNPDFTDYYIGKPFISDDDIEVPVRFYSSKNNNSFLDINLYISKKENELKITQILII